ncbi:MAG TPA: hypothetical protein VFZ60_06225 [Nitrososphaeraceae archaeon]
MTGKTAGTTAQMVLVSVTIVSLFSLSNIIIPDTALQLVVAEEAQPNVNSAEEINFSSPFSNNDLQHIIIQRWRIIVSEQYSGCI